jgi:uncharacterized protein YehS (DUF1456 family)
MLHNLVLRRLRYALNLREAGMKELFALGGQDLSEPDIANLLRKDDDPAQLKCSDLLLTAFLDGLIVDRRGPKEDAPAPAFGAERLTNNVILRKIRIALEVREDAMLTIMKNAKFPISKGELSALSRRPDARNFKPCGDQFLRNFLLGLCQTMRPAQDGLRDEG